MKTSNSKKRFVLSLVVTIVSIAMLVGATFAWFTDSVTSGKNKIIAGNLDIELEYTIDGETWNPVTKSTKLFGDDALWEPGYTKVAYLRLSNKGNLALKYNLSVNVDNEVEGINVDGQPFKLSDYINMGVDENWDGEVYADRAAALAAVTDAGPIATYTKSDSMVVGAEAKTFAIVAFMPETVGNEANPKTGTTPPSIDFGVSVVATQLSSEEDAFDDQYDITAPWLGGESVVTPDEDGVYNVTCGEELAWVAKQINNGNTEVKSIKLVKDIDLNNIEWIQIDGAGKNIVFDGNDKTIVNLKVSTGHNAGFFASGSGCKIKNLKFDKANVSGIGRIAVVCGHGMCVDVDKCTVINSSVTAVVTNNDDGDKAGAIVGYLSGESNGSVTNCLVENCTVTGYRDVGAVVGYAGGTYTVTGNTAKDCVLVNDRTNNYNNYDTDEKYDVNAIIGEQGTAGTVGNNEDTNVTISKVIPVVIGPGQNPQPAVAAAIASARAGDTIVLPTSDTPIIISSIDKAITLKGDKTTKVDASNAGTGVSASGVIFEDIPFYSGNATYNTIRGTVTYINCIFDGLVNSYDDSTYINCKFTNSVNGKYLAHVYGGTATYTGCTFNGSNRCAYVYTDGGNADVLFENCTFNIDDSTGKAAIMVNRNENNGVSTVVINNCIANGGNDSGEVVESGETNEYHKLWGVKKIHNGNTLYATITVDGTVVYKYPAN